MNNYTYQNPKAYCAKNKPVFSQPFLLMLAAALAWTSLLEAETHPPAQTVIMQEIREHDRAYYAEHTEVHSYTNESGQTMQYRLFMPRNYDPAKKYPLLLSLHGAGERGDDNLAQLCFWVAGWMDEAVQMEHPCILLMPQCPAGQQWVDTPWDRGSYSFSKIPISRSLKLAKEIFDEVVQKKSVDRSRIYVMGASMGGYGTWNFVMRYPELVAAAVPMCGAGDPVMAGTIKNIPIWAFHGDADPVVPPCGSQEMIDAIQRAGGTSVRLTMYQGVKHDCYLKALKEQKLVDWIFKQQKTDIKPDASGGKL